MERGSLVVPDGVQVVIKEPKTYHPFSIHYIALLAPFSVFGVLARLGLSALTTYAGQSIFSLAYSQAVGCLIMGFLLELKEPISRYYPPAYTALTTGFCGSLTTFSGWQLDIFKSWLNVDNVHRAPLRDAMDGVCKSVFTISLSLASLFYGMHLAKMVSVYFRAATPPGKSLRTAATILAILVYAATFPAYFLLPRDYRHQATAAMLFSFPGTLTRYVLAIQLNTLVPPFPLGTYAANTVGTALLGIFHVLQSTSNHALSGASCSLLQGLADGYCGCLTTVSTFAAEIAALKTNAHKYRYGLTTWATGQIVMVCLFGALLWAGNIGKSQTCVFDG
ncbi:CrcB-like protein-domain-containing protein [Favolaschia claudopus]|uniref:CrcB-like protein-domain-containing protein n=1 Tax=Favolaschia claudopus TaxID=2862362 RepID=A0AAW0EC98_9AGAR